MAEINPNVGKKIQYHGIYMGCDPELFLAKGDQIVGAEKVIPEKGLASKMPGSYTLPIEKAIVLDGVQVELNPQPHACRANLANEIAQSFRTLRDHLAKTKEFSVSFRTVVEVDKKELESLSEKSRALGCAPSLNVYDKEASVKVNGAEYRKRSAGGHIHIGSASIRPHAELMVQVMDALVGNTCVMIDRDPEAPERRKVYGRAGEYRTPPHGVEYRTLSNFWLRNPVLLSFVLGMTRTAASIVYTETSKTIYGASWSAATELLSRVNRDDIHRAINENDLELAKANWAKIKGFLVDHLPAIWGSGLDAGKIPAFEYFVKQIEEKGINHWFPMEPMEAWCSLVDQHDRGWESFITNLGARHQAEILKMGGQ